MLTLVFVQIFVRPFRRLAESATAVLNGQEVYPYESRSTLESQVLSAAVARLQGDAVAGTTAKTKGAEPGP
jgi:hypothetical protein